ncbi:OsmC family protein [Marinovum sp.]|uniref:OsmC family protein n=1 Tax=Marinovum sp. TaxID=2024839 RepID=UPI002B27AB5C|nr:OsmC family protein [Marinovum sp.]
MKTKANVIADLGLPLIYRVETDQAPVCAAPDICLGAANRTVVTSLAGFQKEAFVASAGGGATWRMVSDEGKNLNGNDAAPPPLGFLAVGMIASYMTEITALAEIRGVEIRDLKLKLDNYYSMTGSMPRKTMVGGALPVELTVEIDCSLQGSALTQFLMDAVTASPLNGLLRGQLDSLFRLARNGSEIAPADKARPDLALLPEVMSDDPGLGVVPCGDVLLSPIGPSPSAASVGSKASGAYSVKDAKGTLIHVGTSAVYRADGVKEIRQQLYAPNGTEWRFLSDETAANGGQGKAPDAQAYVAAGIGFCFMTQFGILIDVHKLDVARYQILQDMHFSLGGASGRTGRAGDAAAVETHVHLTTTEADPVAQELLFLAEQSCFLHALCRQELKAKLHLKSALVT